MGGSGIEIAATICIGLGFLLTSIGVGLPYWEKNDPEDTVNDNIIRHKGIWVKCVTYSTGNWECDDFNKFFLGLSTVIQVSRGFGVTAVVFSVIGCIAMILGMENVPCGGDSRSTKRRIRLVGGSLAVVAGFLIIAAVSWFANQLRIDYELETLRKRAGANVTRNVFGESLFLGWAGGVLLALGGLLGICTACGDSEDDQDRGYVYRPPVSNKSQEYV